MCDMQTTVVIKAGNERRGNEGRRKRGGGKTDLFQHTPQSLVSVLLKRVEIIPHSATEQNWVLHIHTLQYPTSYIPYYSTL